MFPAGTRLSDVMLDGHRKNRRDEEGTEQVSHCAAGCSASVNLLFDDSTLGKLDVDESHFRRPREGGISLTNNRQSHEPNIPATFPRPFVFFDRVFSPLVAGPASWTHHYLLLLLFQSTFLSSPISCAAFPCPRHVPHCYPSALIALQDRRGADDGHNLINLSRAPAASSSRRKHVQPSK